MPEAMDTDAAGGAPPNPMQQQQQQHQPHHLQQQQQQPPVTDATGDGVPGWGAAPLNTREELLQRLQREEQARQMPAKPFYAALLRKQAAEDWADLEGPHARAWLDNLRAYFVDANSCRLGLGGRDSVEPPPYELWVEWGRDAFTAPALQCEFSRPPPMDTTTGLSPAVLEAVRRLAEDAGYWESPRNAAGGHA
mgnify:FL=1